MTLYHSSITGGAVAAAELRRGLSKKSFMIEVITGLAFMGLFYLVVIVDIQNLGVMQRPSSTRWRVDAQPQSLAGMGPSLRAVLLSVHGHRLRSRTPGNPTGNYGTRHAGRPPVRHHAALALAARNSGGVQRHPARHSLVQRNQPYRGRRLPVAFLGAAASRVCTGVQPATGLQPA